MASTRNFRASRVYDVPVSLSIGIDGGVECEYRFLQTIICRIIKDKDLESIARVLLVGGGGDSVYDRFDIFSADTVSSSVIM